MPTLAAALVKCRSSATARKYRMWRSSIVISKTDHICLCHILEQCGAQFQVLGQDSLSYVDGAQLVVEHLLVKDDQAVVELHSLATAKNGLRFDNRYCWVVHFAGDTIDRVRAYLDSAMVARLFEENPI